MGIEKIKTLRERIWPSPYPFTRRGQIFNIITFGGLKRWYNKHMTYTYDDMKQSYHNEIDRQKTESGQA